MKRIPGKLPPAPALPSPPLTRLAARAAVLAVLLLAGCAGFERDWKKAVTGSGLVPAAPGVAAARGQEVHEGAWTGTWTSAGTGHAGKLRCLVDPAGAAGVEGRPEAAFTYHATWAIFSGTFATRQTVVQQPGGGVRSTGAWTLPKWAGGRYEYDITITGTRFSGTWRGGGDSGAFEMARPEPAARGSE